MYSCDFCLSVFVCMCVSESTKRKYAIDIILLSIVQWRIRNKSSLPHIYTLNGRFVVGSLLRNSQYIIIICSTVHDTRTISTLRYDSMFFNSIKCIKSLNLFSAIMMTQTNRLYLIFHINVGMAYRDRKWMSIK